MQQQKQEMFRNRLFKKYRHSSKIARRQQVSCYRIFDHDLPEFPLSIDLYENKIYIAEYKRNHGLTEDMHSAWLNETIESVISIIPAGKEHVFIKLRQRKAGRGGQYQKEDNTNNEFIVQEGGLQFIVNLSDYLDTGLFPDHRITRSMVRENSHDKKVLNLFAYTGSFSVYAAAGGALQVTTVDLSNTYINWAKRNMQLNGFINNEYAFIVADVFQYLKSVPPESFDMIILDPPTFSNSKKMDTILDIQRDHVALINDCIKLLSPGGLLYFSTNARTFTINSAAIHSSNIKDITKATTSFDFEGKLYRWCYLIQKN